MKNNSSMNKIYHNAANKETTPKEKIWITPFLLENTTNFQQPDDEVGFLIDSGAESNNSIIPTWKEFRNFYPKLSPFKNFQ